MATPPPVRSTTLLKLLGDGITPDCIQRQTVRVLSEKYVTVRDVEGEAVLLVDVEDQTIAQQKGRGDTAVMHPKSRILALQAGKTIQVFDLSAKARVANLSFTHTPQFLTWIDDSSMALVTSSHVYHWAALSSSSSTPRKQFERVAPLKEPSVQIQNYQTDATGSWLLLTALLKQENEKVPVKGLVQLYSVEKKVSKTLDGHAGLFVKYSQRKSTPSTLMCIASRVAEGGRLLIAEMPTSKKQTSTYDKKSVEIPFRDTSTSDFDFPLCMGESKGLLCILTRLGQVFVFDIDTARLVCSANTHDASVQAAPHPEGGFVSVNSLGCVRRHSLVYPAIVEAVKPDDPALALTVAGKAKVEGAVELYQQRIGVLISKGEAQEAMELALNAPNNCLRTLETVKLLLGFPQIPGQPSTAMQYFQRIIDIDRLNEAEAVELAKIVLLKQGGAEFLADISRKGKLEASEELGDRVQPVDLDLAHTFYAESRSHAKALNLLLQRHQYAKALSYIKNKAVLKEWCPDWKEIVVNLAATNADGAAQFALQLHEELPGHAEGLSPDVVVDLFLERNCVKQATTYLVGILNTDREEDADLQTRLFEMNLLHSSAQVVEALFSQVNPKYTRFHSRRIAELCEKAGLHTRALKLYTKAHIKGDESLQSVLRCAVAAGSTAGEWLNSILKVLPAEDALAVLSALVNSSPRQHSKVCAEAASGHLDKLGRDRVLQVFAEHKAYSALFQVLETVLENLEEGSEDEKELHTKFIECALRSGQTAELERMTRTSTAYDPDRVLGYLTEVRPTDPWPYINVCHNHAKWSELVRYLIQTRNLRYLDLYLSEKAPEKTPEIVHHLIEEQVEEEYIATLVAKVPACPVGRVLEVVEAAGKVLMLLPWMEQLEGRGCLDPTLVTALAKHYIETAREGTAVFLERHQGRYDATEVGEFAEAIGGKAADELALAAYISGGCDAEVLRLAKGRKMFAELSDYLLKRADLELWATALQSTDDDEKDSLVEAIASVGVPKVTDPKQVSVAVKAFQAAGIPDQLTAVLEKLILDDPDSKFAQNRYLQNLLLLTVIQNTPENAMGYVRRMNKFDTDEIASLALQKGLYEEVLQMYKQSMAPSANAKAMKVLLHEMDDLERGRQLAEEADSPECWRLLGERQLQKLRIREALTSVAKANDQQLVREAVAAVNKSGDMSHLDALISCLQVARDSAEDGDMSFLSFADTELAYLLARCERFTDLTQFLARQHLASLSQAGERCFSQELYEAARVLFTTDHNYSRLASTLLHLTLYLEALDAAQKASSVATWKEVCYRCVVDGELRLAQMAAQHIIVVPDQLDELVAFFERSGSITELQALLKTGLSSERTHTGMYTSLGVLYAKYDSDKVLGYLKLYEAKINKGELLRVCEEHHLWREARYIYACRDDWDSVLRVMLDHPVPAWEHEQFLEASTKATVLDHIYAGLTFYLEEHPGKVLEFLEAVGARLNPERVVATVQRLGVAHIVKPWLLSVQKVNNRSVNDALNALLIEEEDYQALRTSLASHTNFERTTLCEELSQHPLMEMRRVASWLHAESGRFQAAIDQAFADGLYKDATSYAAQSNQPAVADLLIRRYVDAGLFECFAAALYACYDISQPDVALELAWRNKKQDLVMPYMIQVLKDLWDSRSQKQNNVPRVSADFL